MSNEIELSLTLHLDDVASAYPEASQEDVQAMFEAFKQPHVRSILLDVLHDQLMDTVAHFDFDF